MFTFLIGLCGNFNGMEGDDFKTTNGLVEATGSAFANTWKAQPTCADQAEKLEDPCTLSIESGKLANKTNVGSCQEELLYVTATGIVELHCGIDVL